APADPHRCAVPVLKGLLAYHELRGAQIDARGARRTQGLETGELRVALGFKSLWLKLLDTSKTWGAVVGSLGFCDCPTLSRQQVDQSVVAVGLHGPHFAARMGEPSSIEFQSVAALRGCDEIWGFDVTRPVEERLRGFIAASSMERSRCAPLQAAFLSVCAQNYLARQQPLKARDALHLAAMVSLLAGDCSGELTVPPPLASADILYNHARAQRYAREVEAGRAALHEMAWRPSP
ncbi:unnamed protein product, partial [Prorocentrum cordatum]